MKDFFSVVCIIKVKIGQDIVKSPVFVTSGDRSWSLSMSGIKSELLRAISY